MTRDEFEEEYKDEIAELNNDLEKALDKFVDNTAARFVIEDFSIDIYVTDESFYLMMLSP